MGLRDILQNTKTEKCMRRVMELQVGLQKDMELCGTTPNWQRVRNKNESKTNNRR